MKKIVSFYVKVRMVYLIAGLLAVMFFGIQFCLDKFYSGVAIIIMGLLIIGKYNEQYFIYHSNSEAFLS